MNVSTVHGMTAPTTAEEAVQQAALNAKSVTQSNDSVSVTERSAEDLLKLAAAQAGQTSASKPHFGLRMTKLVPPGLP